MPVSKHLEVIYPLEKAIFRGLLCLAKYFAKKRILQTNIVGFFKTSKKHCFESISVHQKQLQSFTKYLRLTHVKLI